MSIKDNEAVYDSEIAPLMAQIITICKDHEIPMGATFEYAPEMYCTTTIPANGQSDHMAAVNRLLSGDVRDRALQLTTTKPDGSKVIEVILS